MVLTALLMKDKRKNPNADFFVYELFETRQKAEELKEEFENYDKLNGTTNVFEYKVQAGIGVRK